MCIRDSCTCVFMAVFIPVTFMGGTSGVFYTQFGITMATAVGDVYKRQDL